MLRFRESRWFYDPSYGALRRTVAGEYEPDVSPPTDLEIPFREIPSLVQALEENGLLKPRLDERLRTEDLKITHRLMDLLGQAIGQK